MSSVVLSVEDVWKQYKLGTIGTGSFKEDFNKWLARLKRQEDPTLKIGETNDRDNIVGDYVWALKNISFDVKQGEVLGIVGRNGAGKSTLLKILSKVTGPSKGSIKVKGRIASLLEVGTGFHPELTGRENVFLNGAILGMKKAEVKRKFDEIVDFSGIGKYIDTPVKRYSSGMYVRLAFSVAAHLDSEIVIVDEVLAVGDSEFQSRCMDKMKDVSSGQGRTVLFVSHNLGSVAQLCDRSVLLKYGTIQSIGNTSKILEDYHSDLVQNFYNVDELSSRPAYFEKLETVDGQGERITSFAHSEEIRLRLSIAVNQFSADLNIGLALCNKFGQRVFTVNKLLSVFYKPGQTHVTAEFIIEGGLIAPSDYSFLVALNAHSGKTTFDARDNICQFKVYDDGTEFAEFEGFHYGSIIIKDNWKVL